MNRSNTKIRAVLAAGALAMVGVGLQGCNLLGPGIYLVTGPGEIEALYQLPKEQVGVVFIDDPMTLIPSRDARVTIGTTCEEDLLGREIVKEMIKSRIAMQQIRNEKRTDKMPIASVGKSVGAQFVVYAMVRQWSMSEDGQSFKPTATVDVKVIDVASGERLFPPADAATASYTLTLSPPSLSQSPPSSRAAMAQAELALAKELGLGLARLFYDHAAPSRPSMKDEKAPK